MMESFCRKTRGTSLPCRYPLCTMRNTQRRISESSGCKGEGDIVVAYTFIVLYKIKIHLQTGAAKNTAGAIDWVRIQRGNMDT